MKILMGLRYSRQGLMYTVVGSLLLLGALGILNWSFAWIIIALGLIVYGLMLCGADNLIKCKVSPRKK
ncbi:TPA: hypothetical protein DIC20_02535 [Candidatus Dependentiae bacterium]|nr:hypothetical protein [Candidatus Dependentiae bacterium]HCU00556.1 hypothetical protein [Candidatus Dependentiae bacterium]